MVLTITGALVCLPEIEHSPREKNIDGYLRGMTHEKRENGATLAIMLESKTN